MLYSGKTFTTRTCISAVRQTVHLPYICQRGCKYILLMAYVTDNIRFRRVPFRVRDAFRFSLPPPSPLPPSPLYASFSCDVNPGDNDKVGHWCCSSFQRHPAACKNNPPAVCPLIFWERERKKNIDFMREPSFARAARNSNTPRTQGCC